MALLLRNLTSPKWSAPEWMPSGDVPADALSDLRSSNNALSVWSVALDQADLDLALAALASNRDRLDKLDYTLLDDSILVPLSIKCVDSEANTPYVSANAAHRDLIELTVKKVARLAEEMMPLPRVRVPEKRVKQLLVEALEKGALDRALMKPDLLNELESRPKVIPSPPDRAEHRP
jgi:hypothetical protein